MTTPIFKNDAAKNRMEKWYGQFLKRAGIPTDAKDVPTSYGSNHVLTAGDPYGPSLVCLHSMMTSSAHLLSELSSN